MSKDRISEDRISEDRVTEDRISKYNQCIRKLVLWILATAP